MTAVPPPPAPDWEAVPPPYGSYVPPPYVGAPVWGGWPPVLPPREPARPVGAGRTRTVLVALVGAVAGAAVAAVVVSMLFLAGARETGEAMGAEVGDRLAEEFGYGGVYTDPFPTPGAAGPVDQTEPEAPGVLGPDPVLDAYAQQCFTGDLQSCDDLYYSSSPGSDYEEYGTSCGRRVEPGVVYSCTELD